MTPEAQRIAIAEACPQLFRFIKFRSGLGLCFRACDGLPDIRDDVFDPLIDLNAMHEAEKMLAIEQYAFYTENLSGVVTGGFRYGCDIIAHFGLYHATATQRAEAFLRTIGKWDDSK